MKPNFSLDLYLVTDRELSLGRDLEFVIKSAVAGGVTMVQLREKNCNTREFLDLAINIKNILKNTNIPLIINDRLDIALAVNADGLHLGQSDMPYHIARKILGNEAIIGLSIENIEQAKLANKMDLDYIGISPVFGTATKTDTAIPLGLEGIKEIKKHCSLPAVAIGGVNQSNALDILKAGADGLAVVSAICSAKNPEHATKELINIIRCK